MTSRESKVIDQTFLALADPTRRGVVRLLREGPRRAGELASELAMSRPAMTRHLRLLRETGLVEEEGLPEDGRVRVFRLRREPFADLRGWLDEIEAYWDLQLDSFKRHAERTRGRKWGRPR